MLGILSKYKIEPPSESIYDITINKLNGQKFDLNELKGKFVLFVNVASKCGFTPQYESLQKLSDQNKDKLIVVCVPCNQFGSQEPGSADEIQKFCAINYGVSFPITEKIMVKGKKQHPLYKWLTNKQLNGSQSSSVKWNFQKYLVSPKGELIDYFFSMTNPLNPKITKHIE